MKRTYIFGVLFFSGLWGVSEAVLGEVLYSRNVPYASVFLNVIGVSILMFAKVFFPQKGTSTFIAALAMLYKFLNAPFFACHLLGILITGICFDLFFSVFKIDNRLIAVFATVYLSYTLFALMITYVFRYEHWVQAGLTKVLAHIGVSGSMSALGCSVLVPMSFHLAEKIKAGLVRPLDLKLQLLPGSVLVATIGLWIFGIAAFLF